MNESSTTEIPWYESNLLWGPLSVGFGILLTVVAAMKHDLRWLLWLAMPCFLFACWLIVKRIAKLWLRWTIGAACGVLICGGLYRMSIWLRPNAGNMAVAQSSPPPSVSSQPASEPRPQSSVEGQTAKQPKPREHKSQATPIAPKPAELAPSISQSNSGGINVQQATAGKDSPIINSPITIGNVPKRISPQDMAAITQYLSNAKSKAHVRVSVDQNSNATELANDFYKAVKDAGWPMADGGVNGFIGFSAPGKKFQGVVVTVKGEPLKPNETVYFPDSDPMFYIGHVVDALKLPHILKRDSAQSDDLITIQFEGGIP